MRATRNRLAVWSGVILAIGASIVIADAAGAQPVPSGGPPGFLEFEDHPTPIFAQLTDCTGGGPASQQFPDFGDAILQAADDFNLSGGYHLTTFIAPGNFSLSGPMGPVTFEIYDNDGPGNLPGTLLCRETGIPNGVDDAGIVISLDASCELGTGTYWVSAYPVMSFAEFGQWFWSSTETGYGSEFVFRDSSLLTGNLCQDWGLGITDCLVGADYPNLCFLINGYQDCDDDDG